LLLQVLKTQLLAKGQGYDDVVYLDAVSNTYVEEVSSCNFFVINGRTIRTPPLKALPLLFSTNFCEIVVGLLCVLSILRSPQVSLLRKLVNSFLYWQELFKKYYLLTVLESTGQAPLKQMPS